MDGKDRAHLFHRRIVSDLPHGIGSNIACGIKREAGPPVRTVVSIVNITCLPSRAALDFPTPTKTMRHVSPNVVTKAERVRTIHRAPLTLTLGSTSFGARVCISKPAEIVVFVTAIESIVVHVLHVADTTRVLVEIVVEVFVVLSRAEVPARGPQAAVVSHTQRATIAVGHSFDTAESAIG